MDNYVTRMNDIVNEYLNINEFQLVFSSFIAKDEKAEKEKDEKFLASFKEFWKSVNSVAPQPDLTTPAVKSKILGKFVERIQEQANAEKIQVMFGLVRKMIDDNVVKARMICEAILKSSKLNFRNESSWCQSFELVFHLLPSIDYKGCRDIFTLVLEKALKDIPQIISQPTSPQIEAVLKVLRLILDRNACLLPAYFCINEILKIYPEGKVAPHWAISKLLADFVDGFRPLAHLVTVSGRSELLPIIGSPCSSLHASTSGIWKLDHKQLTFNFKVQLPYDKSVSGRQYELLRYIVSQPHSRETVCTILGLNKGRERSAVLEEIIVDLVLDALDSCENETSLDRIGLLWQRLSGMVISYFLFNFASFATIVTSLCDKFTERKWSKAREYLMWFILQLCGAGNTEFKDFLPVLKLIELLYPENKPLAVPDANNPSFVFSMAIACLWNFISSKAQGQSINLPQPRSLSKQIQHLENVFQHCQQSAPSMGRIDNHSALLMNAYPVLQTFVYVTDVWFGKNVGQNPGSQSTPIPLELLDLVTYPAKMNFIMFIGNKRIFSKNANATLSPALLETYSRLLVDNDIPGIRNVVASVLPNVFKNKAWGILHNLLEMFSYRLHYIPQNYRITLFSHIHSMTGVPHTNQNQLHLCLESTAFRLIHGLENHVVESYFTKHEASSLVSTESEELNRIFVLTIARAMHISGTEQQSTQWYEAIFKAIVEKTPMNWSKHTLEHFPPLLQQFFSQHPAPTESKAALKQRVDEEYGKFKNMKSPNEILNYFGEPSSPNIFVCIIWRCLLETGRINQTCLLVLEKLGARALSNQIRVFADFFVQQYSLLGSDTDCSKRINCLHDMVWKYHVMSIDKLVLCLMLRCYEANEAQVCNLLITFLLLKNSTFRDRIHAFVQSIPSNYWVQSDWHQKHQAYYAKWPEKFYFEGLREATKSSSHNVAYLPVNFGNVCLRFLPVLDVIIHRFIELTPVGNGFENLLHNFGTLYKFHDRPITYLYNTLHYYNHTLAQRQTSKTKLVSVIIGAFSNIHPRNWCLSNTFLNYLNAEATSGDWKPDLEYYCCLVGRLVDTISGNSPFPAFDWRFNEFSNASAHALHVTCVELMSLPVSNEEIGQALFSIIYKCGETSRGLDIVNNMQSWINAVALIISSLPESFGKILHAIICEVLTNNLSLKDVAPVGKSFTPDDSTPSSFPYSFYCFKSNAASCSVTLPDLVVSFSNAVWYHSNLGQLSLIPVFLRESLKPLVQNEAQFLFICRLLGPFLFRFYTEKPRCLLEITKELYSLLDIVDKRSPHLYHVNTICDFFYHIKYMYVGDAIKQDVQHYVASLRPVLQNRLQFISHAGHTREETSSVSSSSF